MDSACSAGYGGSRTKLGIDAFQPALPATAADLLVEFEINRIIDIPSPPLTMSSILASRSQKDGDILILDALSQHHGNATEYAGAGLGKIQRLFFAQRSNEEASVGDDLDQPIAASVATYMASRIGPRLTPSLSATGRFH